MTVPLSPTAPGIFVLNTKGLGAIINADGSLVAPVGTFPQREPPARPAKPGDVIVIFASGLGPVSPPLPSGLAADPTGATIHTITPPQVLIGGQPAPVLFAGLSPGFVGLYQLNVEVPENASTGDAVDVVLTTAVGQTSNAATIAVSP